MQNEELDTPAKRVAHAIEASGKTLAQLGELIGCKHATLSQWQTGATDMLNVKVHLLLAFSECTGTDMRWLLTGDEPRVSRYALTKEMERIAAALNAMQRTNPQQIETIVLMVEAAATRK